MILKKIDKIVLLTISILLLLFGILYIKYLWNYNTNLSSQYSIKIAEIAKNKFSDESINKLNISTEDLDKKEYKEIKQGLMNIISIEKDARFSYIYVKKGEKLYFLADSEPEDSKDYSPPGQEYYDADNEYYRPFIEKQSLITKPSTDRWGTWVSILSPIKDSKSDEVIAVFAMDYPASKWSRQAIYITASVSIIVIFLIILLIAIYIIINSNYKRNESEIKYKFLFDFLEDAVMTLNPPSWKFTDGNKATLEIFGLKDIEDLKNVHPADLSPKYQPDGELSSDKAQKMIQIAIEKGSNTFEWMHKKKNGPEFLARVSLVRVQISENIFLQAVVTDITIQKKSQELMNKSIEETRKALENAEKANRLMVGRELEMIKLKKEIAKLKADK